MKKSKRIANLEWQINYERECNEPLISELQHRRAKMARMEANEATWRKAIDSLRRRIGFLKGLLSAERSDYEDLDRRLGIALQAIRDESEEAYNAVLEKF